MKNEEAKRIAMGLRTDFKCESETMVDFCNTVIKALEQQPILDKIRADVINIADGRRSIPVRSVIKIFDKYRAESED